MSGGPPYAGLLKRRPEQARSARRVEALLDAAAELLDEHEPEAITIRGLARAAGVPTGTLYQFFDDRDAVFQALALRFLAAMPAVLDVVDARPRAAWPTAVDLVVDAYAQLVQAHPALRRLWLSGSLDAATRRVERSTDDSIAERLGATLTARGAPTATAVQWRTLVALIDGLLRHAFAEDPAGDPAVLAEGRRAARAYVAALA